MQKVFRTAAALLLAATVATPALAQTLTGSITGIDQGRAGRGPAGRHRHADRQTGLQDPGDRQRRASTASPHSKSAPTRSSPICPGSRRPRGRRSQISPGKRAGHRSSTEGGRRRDEHHRRPATSPVVDVKSSATRDDDLAVAALQRADHPHRDQRDQLRARREQQLGLRRRRRRRATRCSSTASTRAIRAAARRGPSTTTTWSRNTSSRAWARRRNTAASPARWSTPSPSRAATGSAGCSTSSARNKSLGSNNVSSAIAAANPTPGRSGDDDEVRGHHDPVRRADQAEQAVLLRQRAAVPARDRSDRPASPIATRSARGSTSS